jgi:DNA-binding beta-propeller fold protein YncE
VANNEGVLLYDTAKLIAGDTPPLAAAKSQATNGRAAGSVYVGISPDGKLLFVSDENAEAITVYDLPRLGGGDTKAIGRIPVGRAPVGLVFSPDGRTLYSTSERAAGADEAPATCKQPGAPPEVPNAPPGSLYVIDVATAGRAPADAIRAKVEAGCAPVRVELSRDGGRAYVTTRSDNALAVFDTARLVRDGINARIATIPTGVLPVGVIVAPNHVVVGNSNRIEPNSKGEWLSVIDPLTNQVIGNILAGGFPREMAVTGDGKTLLVGNFASQNLTVVNLAGLTPTFFAAQKTVKATDDAARAKAAADLQARIAVGQASPGTEAALRKWIAALQSGMPDMSLIGNPQLAEAIQNTKARATQRVQEWGALQSVTFSTVTPTGADVFIVVFEKQRTRWSISLAPDGRIQTQGFGPMPPGQ